MLRITAPIPWGQRTLCASLPRFLDAHPLLEVELVLSDSLIDLAAERFDIGFRMTARKGATPVGQLIVKVDGEWREAEFSYGMKPLTSK